MADAYYDMKDKMRRSAQDEQAARFRAATGDPLASDITAAESAPMTPDVSAPVVSRRQVIDGRPQLNRPASPEVVRTAKGAGGYEYAELADGSFKILQSPVANVGKIVKAGERGYDAIKAEVMGVAKPAARAAAPRDELFPEAAVEMRSPLEETLGTDFEQEMYEVSGVPTRTRSVVGSRILEQADRPAPRPAPLVQPTSPRAMQQRVAGSTNPTYQQMVGETQGPNIRATMGKDLTEAFAFMGQTPEAARTNAEALLGAYEKAGDPTVLRAIQSIIAARAAR
jgi:hypothetical protein